MGSDTKALRTRIKSVDATLHLTKAMGLVASSKIRRANEAMQKSRTYIKNFEKAMAVLTACPACQRSPYLKSGGNRVRIVVIAGDRGLAGGYNANVFRLAQKFPEAEFFPIGKRACERFNGDFLSSEFFSGADARHLANALCQDFINDKYDKLGIISTQFVSVMAQEAILQWLLPLSQNEEKKNAVIFEPDEVSILNTVLPSYIAGRITAAVRESFASEAAARRLAMDCAEKNAGQMMDALQLQYNQARQSAITQEITEIIAGSGM